MIIIGGSGKCGRCGLEIERRFLTKTNKSVCIKCMRVYDPPRMTLGIFDKSPYIWNFEAGRYEKTADIEQLEWCGWFVRSKQEILYGILLHTKAVIYHMEFEAGVKCLRRLDYPFFEDGIQECGVEECREFCNRKEPLKFKFPMRRSNFKL